VARNTAYERDDVYDTVRRQFNNAELVELTGICGFFAFNNRFQDSLHLPLEEPGEVDRIRASVRGDPDRLKCFLATLLAQWPEAGGRADESSRTGDRGRAMGHGPDSCGVRPKPSHCADSAFAQRNDELPSRVPLLDAKIAPTESRQFLLAVEQLLGAVPNAARVWAHVPHVGKMFFPFYCALEREGAGGVLTTSLKAIALLRTSHVHAAPYGLGRYTELARNAGVTRDQLVVIGSRNGAISPLFSPRERAAMVWAEHVASNTAKRNEAIFDELKEQFTNVEIVELTGLCATCNMATLMYNALRVPPDSPVVVAALNQSAQANPGRIKTYLQTVLEQWPREFPVPDAGAAA